MKTPFHYAVKINLINYNNIEKVKFIEHFQEFRDDNPIKARIAAFNFYQNWVDILLESVDKKYSTDRQAREDLKTYITPNLNVDLNFSGTEINLSDSLSVGIGVYLVFDVTATPLYRDDSLNIHKGDEWLIHGIGNSTEFNDFLRVVENLEGELGYYQNYKFSTESFETNAVCYDVYYQKPEEFDYIETPFDWTGMDNPLNPLLGLELIKDYTDIIENGENETTEFKSTLNFHFTNKTWEGKRDVNIVIAKTICSFLNSNGGLLFIGVRDNGEIQGLDYDFKLSDRENKKDHFRLEFDRVIADYLSFSYKSLINGDFAEIDNKTIFVVEIKPCLTRPSFLKLPDGNKEFWVRGSASTRKLSDIEEIINYWLDRGSSEWWIQVINATSQFSFNF